MIFNPERTIELRLRSVVNQSCNRFSGDETAEIVEKYGAKVYQLDCEGA